MALNGKKLFAKIERYRSSQHKKTLATLKRQKAQYKTALARAKAEKELSDYKKKLSEIRYGKYKRAGKKIGKATVKIARRVAKAHKYKMPRMF